MATIAAEPTARPTSETVRQPSLRSLKERNLMVLTIRKERPRTTTTTISGEPGSAPATAWLATTSETSTPAAPGMGRPTIHWLGFLGAPSEAVASTLKRARRIAPQATNAKQQSAPTQPSDSSDQR